MAWLEICDAVLETSQQIVSIGGEEAYKALVEISSESHKEMEKLYPFRFSLRSYFSRDMQRTFLFDKRKKTRKERHEVIRFNWNKRLTERYKRRKLPRAATNNVENGEDSEVSNLFAFLGYERADFRRSRKMGQKLSDSMLDRLSLLQAVRSQKLVVGQERRWMISDGKKTLNYLVRVQSREFLKDSEQKEMLYKVRFDAFKAGKWRGTPAHPAVYIWMTADERQVPVRFSIDYAMGTFVVQLKKRLEWSSAMMDADALVQSPPAH